MIILKKFVYYDIFREFFFFTNWSQGNFYITRGFLYELKFLILPEFAGISLAREHKEHAHEQMVVKEHHEYARLAVDIFEVYILVAMWNFYAQNFTSKLFSFLCCAIILPLLLCVSQQTIQSFPFIVLSLQLSSLCT